MSKYVIEDTTLISIADAVRDKAGTTDTILVSELPTAIANIPTGGGGGGDLPEEALTITGRGDYRFAYNGWNWFIDTYGNRIKTKDMTDVVRMFAQSSTLTNIPFDINITKSGNKDMSYMFQNCAELTEVPYIKGELNAPTGAYSGTIAMAEFMSSCKKLRYIPDDYFDQFGGDAFWEKSKTYSTARNSMFGTCYSLRKIPKLDKLITSSTSAYSHLYYNLCSYCYALDEIVDIPILTTHTITTNYFISSFDYAQRLKRITFQTNEDGTPLVVQWKGQIINLSNNLGHVNGNPNNVLRYNSGITEDKKVNDEATYQALKDDPDWFSNGLLYSRYNHDSAVETINSLPDTSAYLATAGGTNTIKFDRTSGNSTDGGGIGALTEEEIAVAAAKGWTVTFA